MSDQPPSTNTHKPDCRSLRCFHCGNPHPCKCVGYSFASCDCQPPSAPRTLKDYRHWLFIASDEECGPACMYVPVPSTIDMTDEFREVYCQAWRHSLSDARKAIHTASAPQGQENEPDGLAGPTDWREGDYIEGAFRLHRVVSQYAPTVPIGYKELRNALAAELCRIIGYRPKPIGQSAQTRPATVESVNDAIRRIMAEGGTPFQIEQRLTRHFLERQSPPPVEGEKPTPVWCPRCGHEK
jgi:hypothetical protein